MLINELCRRCLMLILVSIGCILRTGSCPPLNTNAIWSLSIKSYLNSMNRGDFLKRGGYKNWGVTKLCEKNWLCPTKLMSKKFSSCN